MRSFVISLLCAAALASPALARSHRHAASGAATPAQFDHYTLSLTWVPSYCALHSDPAECGRGAGFALHGLWPDGTNRRNDPQNCEGPALGAADKAKYQALYASPSLIAHEWTKHGTCSGLDAANYFGLIKADVAKLRIPDAYRQARTVKASEANALKTAVLAANPDLPADGVKVVTSGGLLSELEICFGRDAGAFVSCGR